MKFYPADWRQDPALRMCCLAARGMWVEMLCLMWQADPCGSLLVNGRQVTPRQLAPLVGTTPKEAEALVQELEEAGVFSRDDDGTIYSRRMRKDIAKAEQDRVNGKGGGNPRLKQGVNPLDKPDPNGGDKAQKSEARSQSQSRLIDDGRPTDPATGEKPISANDLHRKLLDAAKGRVASSIGIEVVRPIFDLMAQGLDLERHILPAIAATVPKLSRPLGSWTAPFIRQEAEALKARDVDRVTSAHDPSDPVIVFGGGFTAKLSSLRTICARGQWIPNWGDGLFEPGCRVPEEYLAELRALWPKRETEGAAA